MRDRRQLAPRITFKIPARLNQETLAADVDWPGVGLVGPPHQAPRAAGGNMDAIIQAPVETVEQCLNVQLLSFAGAEASGAADHQTAVTTIESSDH